MNHRKAIPENGRRYRPDHHRGRGIAGAVVVDDLLVGRLARRDLRHEDDRGENSTANAIPTIAVSDAARRSDRPRASGVVGVSSASGVEGSSMT